MMKGLCEGSKQRRTARDHVRIQLMSEMQSDPEQWKQEDDVQNNQYSADTSGDGKRGQSGSGVMQVESQATQATCAMSEANCWGSLQRDSDTRLRSSNARSCIRPGCRMVVEFPHDERSHDRIFLWPLDATHSMTIGMWRTSVRIRGRRSWPVGEVTTTTSRNVWLPPLLGESRASRTHPDCIARNRDDTGTNSGSCATTAGSDVSTGMGRVSRFLLLAGESWAAGDPSIGSPRSWILRRRSGRMCQWMSGTVTRTTRKYRGKLTPVIVGDVAVKSRRIGGSPIQAMSDSGSCPTADTTPFWITEWSAGTYDTKARRGGPSREALRPWDVEGSARWSSSHRGASCANGGSTWIPVSAGSSSGKMSWRSATNSGSQTSRFEASLERWPSSRWGWGTETVRGFSLILLPR